MKISQDDITTIAMIIDSINDSPLGRADLSRFIEGRWELGGGIRVRISRSVMDYDELEVEIEA